MAYSTTKPIDWQKLLVLTNNDPELAKELLDMFIVELPTMHNAINVAYTKRDYSALRKLIHKLHGSCCYSGTSNLQMLSSQAEVILAARDTPALKESIKKLNGEIERILQYVTQ